MITDPIRTLVDFSFYRDVPRRSFLRTGGYLLYVGFLFSAFATAILVLRLNPSLRAATEWLATSMPSITIDGGKASSAPPGPVVLRPPQETKFGILIDTGRVGPVGFDELASQNIAVAITQDSATLVLRDRGRVEQRTFSGMNAAKPVVFDAAFYRSVGTLLRQVLPILMLLAFWTLFFMWKLLASLLYAVIAFLIIEATSGGLDFPSVFKLAVYAQTPWILLQAVLLPVDRMVPLPLLFLMGVGVTSAYLWKAVAQCRTPAA